MAELEHVIQGASAIIFVIAGLCFLVFNRLKPANSLECRITKNGGWLLIDLGILVALLMQAKAWQTAKALVLGVATISTLFSGVFT